MIKAASCILLLALAVPSHEQQDVPISPCPNVFQYEPLGTEPGRWYGVVNLSTDSTLYSLWLNIVLDRKADILGNWIGYVTTTDNIDFKIENTKMMIHPGPAVAVRFFIQYNTLSAPTPKLQAIRLNGREICNADNPLPVVGRPEGGKPSKPNNQNTTRPVERPAPERPAPEMPAPEMPAPEMPAPEMPEPEMPAPEMPVPEMPAPEGPVTERPIYQQPNSNTSQSDVGGGQKYPGNNIDIVVRPSRPTRPSRPDPEDYEDKNDSQDYSGFPGGLPGIILPDNKDGPSRPWPNSFYEDNKAQCGRVVMQNPHSLVVKGFPTYEGEWPWHVALYKTQTVDNKYICGGTLVSRLHVITATHCVTQKGSNRVINKNTLSVYLAKHNLRTSVEGVQIKLVAQIIKHPEYNVSTYQRDLAVLLLREPVTFTDWVQPACLWPEDDTSLNVIIGKQGSVVGWGFDETGAATEELNQAKMPVVDMETCLRSHSFFFVRFTSYYTFCAGNRNGTSVCNGDSGGGMVFKIGSSWYLRGVTILSVARQNDFRCDPSHYVVFTDVAKFLPWLKQIINE